MNTIEQLEPLPISSIRPAPDEASLTIGLRGSGKSFLNGKLIKGIRDLIIVDPKGEWNPRDFTVIHSAADFHVTGPSFLRTKLPLLYQPGVEHFDKLSEYNEFFRRVFQRGNCTLYNDEIAAFTTAQTYPAYLKAIYMQGRSRGIRAMGTAQRPSAIPVFVRSECCKFYVFFLNDPGDRKAMSAIVPGYNASKLGTHEFFYYDVHSNKPAEKLIA